MNNMKRANRIIKLMTVDVTVTLHLGYVYLFANIIDSNRR